MSRLTPFGVGLAGLCVLQAAVDAVDPTAGDVERLVSFLLVAFGLSVAAGDVVRDGGAQDPPSPATAWLLRRVLLGGAGLLLVLAVSGRMLGPLVDGLFVLAVLLLAASTLGLPAPVGRLGQAAVPVALGVLAVAGVLAGLRLAALT